MNSATQTSPLSAKLRDYALLMRFDKPIGISLLLWPTLWGLWFAADGMPPIAVLLIFITGTVLMRAAGCVINDYADRDFDPHVARTRMRPIAAGRVVPKEALVLFAVLVSLAFLLVLALGMMTVLWSIPAVLIAASYPYAKRLHGLPQAHLGIAFSWGIPMAFVAVSGDVDWPLCAALLAANLCWTIAYDTFYAMADREDDLKIGVKSSAILFGRHDRLITAALQACALALLLLAGALDGRGGYWRLGLAGAAAIAVYQQFLVREREPTACFRAFLNNHYFGMLVFAGLLLDCL
ncbi:MAG: 4-hydroxybenzoate octaprenyltransferase [Pseudomonadota bacterium]|nr:4-hydroxybenzoate octaprenyltransferase [Pseudomonadota bacterium]